MKPGLPGRWLFAHGAGQAWSDARAAFTSALIMLPQAVILATLAGLPPEAGLYASVFAVAAATLVGKCPTVLSGPNTAIALMVAAALTPLAAPLSGDYVRLALTLSLMVGLCQLAMGFLRLGRMLQMLPPFLVQGVTLGVGLVLITTQASAVLGVVGFHGEAPWLSLWRFQAELERANGYALAVAACTVAGGLLAPKLRVLRRLPALVVALACGCLCSAALDAFVGSAQVDIERIGYMTLELMPLSVPQIAWEELYVLKQLLLSAVAIAVVGVLQTLIIIKGSDTGGDASHDSPDREIVAQGLSNIVNAYTSGFAGSGSFNRSASHAAAGAQTRAAGLGSAVIVFLLGFTAMPVIAHIPVVALAGTLLLIGIEMLRSVYRRRLRTQPIWTSCQIFMVAALTLASGLQAALSFGLALGVFMSLWHRSRAQQTLPASTEARPPLRAWRARVVTAMGAAPATAAPAGFAEPSAVVLQFEPAAKALHAAAEATSPQPLRLPAA